MEKFIKIEFIKIEGGEQVNFNMTGISESEAIGILETYKQLLVNKKLTEVIKVPKK